MILLDTHVWLWLRSAPELLSKRARGEVDREVLAVSAVSCWEVATLSRLGRIALDRDVDAWIGRALADVPQVAVLPVTQEIATAAGRLDATFPGDPADRMIFATAVVTKSLLVTKDRRLRAFSPGGAIWD